MATATAERTGKRLIESDRVEGTTVFDAQGSNIGSIKRIMIDKISGQVAYAVMSLEVFSAWARKNIPSHGTSSPMTPT